MIERYSEGNIEKKESRKNSRKEMRGSQCGYGSAMSLEKQGKRTKLLLSERIDKHKKAYRFFKITTISVKDIQDISNYMNGILF